MGVVGLQDMVMTNEDYRMKLIKIEKWKIRCGLMSCECCSGRLWGLRRHGVGYVACLCKGWLLGWLLVRIESNFLYLYKLFFLIWISLVWFGFIDFSIKKPNRTGSFSKYSNRFFFMVRFFRLFFFVFSV
jgi:hypothetical protein